MPNLRILSKRIAHLLRQADIEKEERTQVFVPILPSQSSGVSNVGPETVEQILEDEVAATENDARSIPSQTFASKENTIIQTTYDQRVSSADDLGALAVHIHTEIREEQIRDKSFNVTMPYVRGVHLTAERKKEQLRNTSSRDDARMQRLAAFKELRKRLKDQAELKNQLDELSPEFLAHMENLRSEFVRRARHYLGCPYRQGAKPRKGQFIGNGTADQNLFLDCCGLVRRCVQDLKDDFKFELGPWNQAYLFDTLPVKLTAHEMLPGDLIFVQGIYNDKSKKRLPHDILHVEIFVGGESGATSILNVIFSKVCEGHFPQEKEP